jgi:hypothetical protein
MIIAGNERVEKLLAILFPEFSLKLPRSRRGIEGDNYQAKIIKKIHASFKDLLT